MSHARGQGAAGAGHYPKLAGDPALVAWEYVAMTVLNGKNGMPAFGLPPRANDGNLYSVHLSDAQVADVVNYVRSNFGNHYKGKITARTGRQLYRTRVRLRAKNRKIIRP